MKALTTKSAFLAEIKDFDVEIKCAKKLNHQDKVNYLKGWRDCLKRISMDIFDKEA
jgi:hypothetical protein